MNYTNVAKEAYEMYRAFRDECFDAHQAFELTKICLLRSTELCGSLPTNVTVNNVETRINVAGRIAMKNGTNLDVFEVTRPEDGSMQMLTMHGRYAAEFFGDHSTYYKFNEATNIWEDTDDIDYIVIFE